MGKKVADAEAWIDVSSLTLHCLAPGSACEQRNREGKGGAAACARILGHEMQGSEEMPLKFGLTPKPQTFCILNFISTEPKHSPKLHEEG